MASPETRQINAINATWAGASGAATDIDEVIGSPDTAYYGAGAEADAADFGFTASEVVDGDTVTNISFNMIYRDDGGAGTLLVDVDLLIGGVVQGTAVQLTVSGSDATYSDINDTGWNTDFTAAEMDGAELRLTPTQAGMPGSNAGYLETANMVVTFTAPPLSPTYDLTGYRWYFDGSESAADFRATENRPITVDPSETFPIQLRLQIQNDNASAGATTDDWQLQYRVNGGSWGNVTVTTSELLYALGSASLTDGSATTNRADGITDPSGTFVAGEQDETSVITDHQITASNFTEHVFALALNAAGWTHGDLVEFRILYNGSAVDFTYTQTPTINVSTGYPYVTATNVTEDTDGGTTTPVNLPNGVVSGDRLHMHITKGSGNSASVNTPTGWTPIHQTDNSNTVGGASFYRDADGGEGATVLITLTTGDEISAVTERIVGHDAATAPEWGTATTGTSTIPDPPSLTPSWGSAANLWTAVAYIDADSMSASGGNPSGYDDVDRLETTSVHAGTQVAAKGATAATENPGTFLIVSDDWVAQTIATSPAAGGNAPLFMHHFKQMANN